MGTRQRSESSLRHRAEEPVRIARKLVLAGARAEEVPIIPAIQVERRPSINEHSADGVALLAADTHERCMSVIGSASEHRPVETQLVGDETGEKEALSHQRPSARTQSAPLLGRAKQLHGPLRTLLDRVHEEAARTVLKLERDPSRSACDDGRALPK